MTSKATLLRSALMLTGLFSTAPLMADATLTLKDSKDGSESVIQVKEGMARMTEASGQGYTLYDKARNLVIHVDSAKQEYTEMDQAALKQQAEFMTGMRQQMAEQMKAQLQGMPPEQRAAMEQQMGGMLDMYSGEPKAAVKIRAEARGREKVNGYDCRQHDLYQGKEKVAQACMATAADAGISEADYATLMAMMVFMREMAQSAQGMAGPSGDSDPLTLSGVQGIPVAMKDFKYGEDYALAAVSTKKLDKTLFTAYTRYNKQELPEVVPSQPSNHR